MFSRWLCDRDQLQRCFHVHFQISPPICRTFYQQLDVQVTCVAETVILNSVKKVVVTYGAAVLNIGVVSEKMIRAERDVEISKHRAFELRTCPALLALIVRMIFVHVQEGGVPCDGTREGAAEHRRQLVVRQEEEAPERQISRQAQLWCVRSRCGRHWQAKPPRYLSNFISTLTNFFVSPTWTNALHSEWTSVQQHDCALFRPLSDVTSSQWRHSHLSLQCDFNLVVEWFQFRYMPVVM